MLSFSDPPAEVSGPRPLPFVEFLDLLRAKGLGVGLHEYLAAAKLMSRWHGAARDEFRDALAALIGRHEGEVQAIRNLFDEVYPPEQRAPPPVSSQPTIAQTSTWIGMLTSRMAWAAIIGVLTLAFAAAVTVRYYSTATLPALPPAPVLAAAGPAPPAPAELSDPIPAQPLLPDAMVQAAEPPPADLGAPQSRVDRGLLGALSLAVLMVSLGAFWAGRMQASARKWTIDAWQAALAALPGPYHPRLVLNDLITRLPRNDIEDAATVLSRAFSTFGRGRTLDVGRSLRETLRSGLRPALFYRPRRVQQTVLVLQDTAQTMAVHEARVENLLGDLRRQGVIFERWYFDGDVSVAAHRRNGPPISLEALARRREDWPLMIISSALGLTATLTHQNRSWMAALRTWTRRVWISPIQDRQLWPAALRRIPIKAVPMTREGLLEAATILARGESSGERAIERPITVIDVKKLKRLAAIVPNPTIPELQLLRQRFAPEVPERAVMHLAANLDTHTGAPVRMSDDEIREHLRQLRREAPELELNVRRYLVKVLGDSEPVPGSAAHMRWQAQKAIHEVRIAELTSADTRAPLAALAAAAKGPLWREVREAMERLAPAAEHTSHVRKAAHLGGDRRRPPTFRDTTRTVHVQPFSWQPPRWQHIAAAIAITLIAAAAASRLEAFRTRPAHHPDAYALEYFPSATAPGGELRITSRQDAAPRDRVWLYRNGEPWVQQTLGPDGSVSVPIPDEPYAYQARAQSQDGSWSFSNALWAPSVLILIDAQPWARVTARSSTGVTPPLTETTPAAFRLPPGEYELSLENGNVTPPLNTTIDVAVDGQRTFRFDMPGFDPNQILPEFGVTGSPPPAMAQ